MASAPPQSPSDALLTQAVQQYPFIKQYNPLVSYGHGEGYAETWPADEEGDKSYPRPKEFPMGRIGVQIFRPDKFSPTDLAAEFLHVDPIANDARNMLRKTLSPAQMQQLKKQSLDYQGSLKNGQGEDRAVQNGIDAALRGYTTGQWPDADNAAMAYSPEQKKVLDDLRTYMTTGHRVAPPSVMPALDNAFSR